MATKRELSRLAHEAINKRSFIFENTGAMRTCEAMDISPFTTSIKVYAVTKSAARELLAAALRGIIAERGEP